MGTSSKFISSFGWNGLTVILQVVIQLIYTSILARLIAPESFGLMGIAITAVGFAEIFSQIGIGPALVQRKEIHDQHITGAFYSSLILGLGFTLLFIGIAPWISRYYDSPELIDVIRVISISFTLSAIGIVPRSLMIRAMNFKKFFIAGMVSIIGGNLIVGLTLAWLDYDIWAYVFALFSQNLLMTIAFWVLNPVKINWKWEWKYTRQLIRYGGGSTLFNAFNYAGTRIDTLLVPKFIDGNTVESRMSSAGQYERSSYLMGLPITILGKLSDNVMFSGLSSLQEEKVRLRKAFFSAVYFIALLVIPACVFLILFAEEIVVIYLGRSYEAAIPIVQVLFIGVIFRSIIKLCDSVLRALDKLYTGSVIKIAFCVTMVVGILFLIPNGLVAVAWAVLIATLIQFVLIIGLSMKLIEAPFKKIFSPFKSGIALGLVIVLISFPCRYVFDQTDLPALPALCIAIIINGLALFIVAWYMPFVFGRGDQNVLLDVLKRLPKNRFVKAFIARFN